MQRMQSKEQHMPQKQNFTGLVQSLRPKGPQTAAHDGEPWSLWIGDVKVCAKVYDSVANAVSGKVAAQYWDTNKQRFNPHSLADVDWDATEMAMKSQPRTRQQWISKHTTGFCAVGKIMLHRKK
jgi:hypothetical protein